VWKYVAVAAAVLVVLALVGASRTQTAAAEPPAQAATGSGEIHWLKSLDAAQKEARAEHKPILVDFFATWCGPCRMMDEETWPNADVKAAVTKYVPVRQDVDANQDVASRFDIESIPTVVILDADGKELDRNVGFADPAELLKLLNKHCQ